MNRLIPEKPGGIARALSLIAMLLVSLGAAADAQSPALARGVNLSHWLTYYGRQPVIADDMARIRDAGFDHVRIPFDPAFLGWHPEDGPVTELQPGLSRLAQAVELASKAGLVAVLDIHPTEAFKLQLETDARVQANLINLWLQLAGYFSAVPDNLLVYEVLNEPQYWEAPNRKGWFLLRQQMLSAIRASDTHHLVLLSGGLGGGLRGLLENVTVTDPQVAYTLHYYEPSLLTHLGATWKPYTTNENSLFSGLAYPASTARLETLTVKPGANPIAVRLALHNYQQQNWGFGRIAADLQKAQNWAQQHGARILCNEFGIARFAVEEKTRSAWLSDVRRALEQFKIGWTVWDYADVFGIATATGSTRRSDDGAVLPNDAVHPERRFNAENLAALIKQRPEPAKAGGIPRVYKPAVIHHAQTTARPSLLAAKGETHP